MFSKSNSTTLAGAVATQNDSWSISSMKTWDWFALILPLIAISPLLYVQCYILWGKQHLQFYPLAWGSVVYFLLLEGNPSALVPRQRGMIAFCVSCFSILLCYASLVLFSSWLAQFSLIVIVWSWALGRFGNLTPLRLTGICGLLLITLPAPSGWDAKLVQMLQSLSSTCCSRLMDVTHIQHIRAGNVIEISSKPLFVEEACSGVDSQYALMAIAGVWLLIGKTNFWVSVCTIVTVPIWAILGNLLRIYSIVIGLEFFDVDLSVGFSHTLLGLLAFSVAAYAHWSSVQIFNYCHGFIVSQYQGANVVTSEAVWPVQNAFEPLSRTQHRWWLLVPAPMLLLTMVAISGVLLIRTGDYSLEVDERIVDRFPDKQDLPTSCQAFGMASFRKETRDRGDLLGQYSRVWTYDAVDGGQLIASLDLPFRGWHPLWECYENAGWKRLETSRIVAGVDGGTIKWPAFKVQLINQEQKHGLLLFSLFDQFGKPYDFDGSFEYRREGSRFNRSILNIVQQLRSGSVVVQDPMTFQFQTLFLSDRPFDERDTRETLGIFLQLRDRAFASSKAAISQIR